MSDPPTQPFSPFPKRRPVYKNNWVLIVVGLVVVVLVVIGSGVKAMNNHQNAQVAKVQLQVKADRDAAAIKAKNEAAAAKAQADGAAAQAAAVAKARQDAALAKAQADAAQAKSDAADAKAQAQANANKAPTVIVVPAPVSGAPYYDSSSASATLNTYFNGISSGDYATAWNQLDVDAQAQQVSFSNFRSGLLSSIDTGVVVNSVSNLGGGTIVANVSFHSHQAPDQGVNPGETDTNWNIDYTLVPGSGAGGYLIHSTSNTSHSAG